MTPLHRPFPYFFLCSSAVNFLQFLRLFLYRRYMSVEALEKLREARGGDHESEIIKIKLVPIDDLWKEAPDAKALSSLYHKPAVPPP